jgi:hypothetical protein
MKSSCFKLNQSQVLIKVAFKLNQQYVSMKNLASSPYVISNGISKNF